MAIQLHEGRSTSLGKLLLAHLYQSLGEASSQLKSLPDYDRGMDFLGRLWFLQHWLTSTLKHQLGYPISEEILRLNKAKTIEGLRFSLATLPYKLGRFVFMKYVNMFLDTNTFVLAMASFMERRFGPDWFRDPFPDVSQNFG